MYAEDDVDDSKRGEQHALDDLQIFNKALIRYVRENLLIQLPREAFNGEEVQVRDNVLMLIDAMMERME